MLCGEAGTKVKVSFQRDGVAGEQEAVIQRKEVKLRDVPLRHVCVCVCVCVWVRARALVRRRSCAMCRSGMCVCVCVCARALVKRRSCAMCRSGDSEKSYV
jgi:hypothetical protein